MILVSFPKTEEPWQESRYPLFWQMFILWKWIIFFKSRASVVAAIIILAIILFSVLCPLLITTHDKTFLDTRYDKKPARVTWLRDNLGIFDGGVDSTVPEPEYIRHLAIGVGAADYTGVDTSLQAGLNTYYQPVISSSYAGEFVNAKKQKENNHRPSTYAELSKRNAKSRV